ncbi:MAG TPA: T9SS type A sorting domain-containing protein [Brumimicrobium sp.]|nr:T9SS type A sorting domain-containing protein [Brumimicrobium sp.]
MRALFLLAIFISESITAQTVKDQILANTWYLTEMNIDGETYIPPTNEEMHTITMGVEPENEVMYWFHSEVCSSTMGGFITWFSDYQISFFDFAGGYECDNLENQDFEFLYASFFGIGGMDGIPMDCSVVENSDDNLILDIINQFGDTVTYTNQQMTVKDIDAQHIDIYPNPVKEVLIIDNNSQLKSGNIRITDVSGKLVYQQKIKNLKTEVNIVSFPMGIYFVSVEDNGKIIKTEKIVKK